MKKLIYLLFVLFSVSMFAVLPATMVVEIRSTATAGNLNGGGFNAARGGTDYTLQDAAQLNPTDLTTSGAAETTITSAAGGFTSQMVGNVIHITAGTAFQTGWYEIVTFTDANNVILDRTPSSGGAGSAGVGYVGGAMSMNSTLDDELFEVFVAGNVVWVKGNISLGESIAVASTSGTTTANIHWIGYASTRGDNPTAATRPLVTVGTFALTTAVNWTIKHLMFTGSAGTVCVFTGNDSRLVSVKVTNTATNAARTACSIVGTAITAINCEFVSQNGVALAIGGGVMLMGCYIHDSDTGISSASVTLITVMFNIFEGNKTADWTHTGTTARTWIVNNTFYGSEAKLGIGLNMTGATATGLRIYNNIFAGKVTGISIGTAAQDSILEDYNTFHNNTTARANIATGANSVTTNPTFAGVAQITGATATTSGSVLTQSGGDFSTVTDNVDYLRVVSGTGVTTGIYLITSHTGTTLTVNNPLGTSSGGDVVYSIGTGHNFAITGGL